MTPQYYRRVLRTDWHPRDAIKEAMTMMTIGTDSHKRTHTFVAVDDLGKRWRSGHYQPLQQATSRMIFDRAEQFPKALGNRRTAAT